MAFGPIEHVVGEDLHAAALSQNEVDARAAAGAPGNDAKVIELVEKLAGFRTAVLKKPADKLHLRSRETAFFRNWCEMSPHAA